jgi:hypothetical protein
MGFRFDWAVDRFVMPTSIQAYPHTPLTYGTQVLKNGDWRSVVNLAHCLPTSHSWVELALHLLGLAVQSQGWWHLWGHSWEIDQLSLWRNLDSVLKEAAASGARQVTNTELAGLVPHLEQ